MSEEWKIDMLKKFWSGEASDQDKLKVESNQKKKIASSKSVIPSIDLHKYHQLDKQIIEAEKAIDQAILQGYNGLIIIHGKGQGILKSQIVKLIKKHHHITEFKSINDNKNQSGSIRVKFKS